MVMRRGVLIPGAVKIIFPDKYAYTLFHGRITQTPPPLTAATVPRGRGATMPGTRSLWRST